MPDNITHKCSQEGTISAIQTKLDRLYNEIEGNGKVGLRDTVTELKVSVDNFSSTTKDLVTSVNALIKFQTEIKTEKAVLKAVADRELKNNEHKNNKKLTIAGMIIAAISVGIGYLLDLIMGK